MSYDVKIGGVNFEYTDNLSALFDEYLIGDNKKRGLSVINGKTGADAFLILAQSIELIDNDVTLLWEPNVAGNPAFYARFDPKNGFGSALGGVLFLSRIMAACAANPNEIVKVL